MTNDGEIANISGLVFFHKVHERLGIGTRANELIRTSMLETTRRSQAENGETPVLIP